MNTKMSKLALAIGALVMAGGAMAADAVGTSNAKVIAPIAIAQTVGLEFGSFSTSAAGDTVIISTAGAATGSALRSLTTTTTAGAFTVLGEAAYTFALTMPLTDTVTTGTGIPAETMELSSFTVAAVGTSTALAGTAPAYTSALDGTTGEHKFTVGATLTTVASQVSGPYTGDYTVTVAYN